jgi:photosystem II stability/assembly factor-like uncharacterized protein
MLKISFNEFRICGMLLQCHRWLSLLMSFCVLFVLASACATSSANTTQQQTSYGGTRVNGFGSSANHVHSLLILPDNVLVLATHYGLYRSGDAGKSWALVGAGPNLPMDGLMTDSLSVSTFNSHRLYVLTQPALTDHKGIMGLYSSADQGRTWFLSASYDELGGLIYTVQAGNAHADEVYAYIATKGAHGLMVSKDNGKHFTLTGILPFGPLLGIFVIPGASGHLLIYTNDGVARSEDGGQHWTLVSLPGSNKSIFAMVSGGPQLPIYASGDGGLYTSTDEGKTFTLVNTNTSYLFLKASPLRPETLYGRTGSSIYQSQDGGQTWQPLPNLPQQQSATMGRIENFTPDPTNATVLYLMLSYPCGVVRYDQSKGQWTSLTPQ